MKNKAVLHRDLSLCQIKILMTKTDCLQTALLNLYNLHFNRVQPLANCNISVSTTSHVIIRNITWSISSVPSTKPGSYWRMLYQSCKMVTITGICHAHLRAFELQNVTLYQFSQSQIILLWNWVHRCLPNKEKGKFKMSTEQQVIFPMVSIWYIIGI